MKNIISVWSRGAAVVLVLLLMFGFLLPGSVGDTIIPPDDWQTCEYGGIAFSLPPGWSIKENGYGYLTGTYQNKAGDVKAYITVFDRAFCASWADRTAEEYKQATDYGTMFTELAFDRFYSGSIGEWKAYRGLLTALDRYHETDRTFIYEAVVAILSSCVEFRMDCMVTERETYEDMFTAIVNTIRDPRAAAAPVPPPTTAIAVPPPAGNSPPSAAPAVVIISDALTPEAAAVGSKQTLKG